MKCPGCQAVNPDDARFCEECGARLGVVCPSCGAPVTPGKKFCRGCGAQLTDTDSSLPQRFASPDQYTPGHLAERILISRGVLEGERKQVTVLFADVKASMELLAERDPEEARNLLDPVLERMMEAVHRYEGTVNQVMGDGIMALFGAPLALEDHATRACYAALAMQSAIRGDNERLRRSQGVEVQVRVGLNSGEVVVRAIGSDLRMDYTAVGQTTHLAARMEQLAASGTIRLTINTLRLAEGLVRVSPLGPMPIRGLTEPVEVFELLGAGPARSRLQAAVVRGLSQFIGRAGELTQLNQALERARAGHGEIVALVGEPGVGKSRLVWEFVHSHRLQEWLVLQAGSVSYGKAAAYRPVIDLLKAYFQIEDRDDARRIREKLTGKLLTLDEALKPMLVPLLALLDVPLDDAHWEQLDPAQKRLRTLDACKRLLLRESQVQCLLLVFEDLHWIDSETQALLDSLVDSLPTARLLLLVNYRPEYQNKWAGKTYYIQLRIDPLNGEGAQLLLDALLGDDASLLPLKRLLIERTEGNPLFLEESVRTMAETGKLQGSRGAYRLAAALTSIQIPATVQAILAARIDRLAPENKRLLQAAAVIGKDVSYALLQAIAGMPEEPLRRGLADLQAGEFLYETSLFPDLEYTFKHALTHEVAYDGVLQERRRSLHTRTLEAMEELYADRLTEQVERLGQHAFRAEQWRQAASYLRQAGEKAWDRSASRAAVASFEQSLAALAHLPDTPESAEQKFDLILSLRVPLVTLGELVRNLDYARTAHALAGRLDDLPRQGWVSAHLSNAFLNVGELTQGLEHTQRALAIAAELGDSMLVAVANYSHGMRCVLCGSYRTATEFLVRHTEAPTAGGADVPSVERGGPIFRYRSIAHQTYVFAQGFLAWCFAELGAFDEAVAHGQEAARAAAVVDQLWARATADQYLGLVYLRRGEVDRAIPLLERCIESSRTADMPLLLVEVAFELGHAYCLVGRIPEAIALLEQASRMADSTSNMLFAPLVHAHLGEAYGLAGRTHDALAALRLAVGLARKHRERGHEAWVLYLTAETQALCNPVESDAANQHYSQALALAQELEMRPLQAQCLLGLGAMQARTGRSPAAHAQLSSAAGMFREMDMRLWLGKAQAALNAL